jgi:hypothetical protein
VRPYAEAKTGLSVPNCSIRTVRDAYERFF